MDAQEFMYEAGRKGPCVGIAEGAAASLVAAPDFEVREITGSQLKTRQQVFDAFAAVWHFPTSFGRNMDAFDDFMRDLDNMIDTTYGGPSPRVLDTLDPRFQLGEAR